MDLQIVSLKDLWTIAFLIQIVFTFKDFFVIWGKFIFMGEFDKIVAQ